MAQKMKMSDEETFVRGRSQEAAEKLMEQAEAAGVSTKLIRTTTNGYIVPSVILDEAADETDQDDLHEQKREEQEDQNEKAAEAGADGDTQADADAEKTETFDPNKHSVKDVKAYLEGADEEERERVLTAEKEGQARPTLVESDENGEQK